MLDFVHSQTYGVNAASSDLMVGLVSQQHSVLAHLLHPVCNVACVAMEVLDNSLVDIVPDLASVVHIDFDLEREMHLELDHSL